MDKHKIFIDGAFVEPLSGDWFESIDPYRGEAWALVPRCGQADVARAVEAADRAFHQGPWPAFSATARGALLRKLGELITREAKRLAELEVRDNGKLLTEMSAQLAYLPQWYHYYGGLADKLEGSVIPIDKPDVFNFTLYEPLGVVAAITPWNSPLLLLTWKLAPALAAGNTMVVKPSEFTSVSTLVLMELVAEAGIPPGVVNVVTGFGAEAGAPLVDHDKVAKVAFTGSDVSGAKIYQAAAKGIKHVSLELGGKSPNIVLDDADLDQAAKGAIAGIFAASGQTCIAGSRLLVQDRIHNAFVDKVLSLARTAKIGDPMKVDTQVGPVTTPPQYKKVLDYIDIARGEGATCVLGGKPAEGPEIIGGQFVEPTIFTGVRNDMRIAQEEVFGPVLGILRFGDEDEAIRIANDVPFGLAAGVWTQSIRRAIKFSKAIRAGTVWVNTYRAVSFLSPFGGYKRSGLGRENGLEAIRGYMQPKSVWISTAEEMPNPFIMQLPSGN